MCHWPSMTRTAHVSGRFGTNGRRATTPDGAHTLGRRTRRRRADRSRRDQRSVDSNRTIEFYEISSDPDFVGSNFTNFAGDWVIAAAASMRPAPCRRLRWARRVCLLSSTRLCVLGLQGGLNRRRRPGVWTKRMRRSAGAHGRRQCHPPSTSVMIHCHGEPCPIPTGADPGRCRPGSSTARWSAVSGTSSVRFSSSS